MVLKAYQTASIFFAATVMSGVIQAAELHFQVSATIVEPTVIQTSFNPTSNTLAIVTKSDANFSLSLPGQGRRIGLTVNERSIRTNSVASQVIHLDSDTSLTVVQQTSLSNDQIPSVILSYN